MTQREITPPRIDLSRMPGESPMRISIETFFDYCFWLAEELQDLEAQYDPYRNLAGFDCDIPFPDDLAAEWT